LVEGEGMNREGIETMRGGFVDFKEGCIGVGERGRGEKKGGDS